MCHGNMSDHSLSVAARKVAVGTRKAQIAELIFFNYTKSFKNFRKIKVRRD